MSLARSQNLPVFLRELTALEQLFGHRNLGSDEQQQIDGNTQQLVILEIIRLNQVRVSQFKCLRDPGEERSV